MMKIVMRHETCNNVKPKNKNVKGQFEKNMVFKKRLCKRNL